MAEVSVTGHREEVRVTIDPAKLRRARSGAVWGPVWLSWGERSFPGTGWDDIALDIVVGIATCVFGASAGTVEVRFPDGPFRVMVGPATDGGLRLVMQNYVDGGEQFELLADMEIFRASVKTCMRLILDKCESEGWSGGRIDYLRGLVLNSGRAKRS